MAVQTEERPIPTRGSEEVWKCLIAGTVHVPVTNERGREVTKTVQGEGNILRISTYDRVLAEERITRPIHNPFRNGSLKHIQGGEEGIQGMEGDTQALDNSDLVEILLEQDTEVFEEMLHSLTEINLRRLHSIAKQANATANQMESLSKVINERFPVGNHMPHYEEMWPDRVPEKKYAEKINEMNRT
jgi:hypothetical protein